MIGTKHGTVVSVLLLHLCGSPLTAGEALPPVMLLRMTAGSSVNGVIQTSSVPLKAVYGRVTLPMSMIKTVRFNDDRTLAYASLSNGDRLSGQIDAQHIDLLTAVGRLSAPWSAVTALSLEDDAPTPEDVTYRPTPREAIRFEVTLRDGSHVLATSKKTSATFYGVFGRLAIPWALVRTISFHDDHETCTVKLWNGDTLVGCVDWKGLPLSTGLGTVHLSTVHTKQVACSLGGIDLVAKPYESARGNRYFMGGLKGTWPLRIRGREYPRSHFIEAHASGRIEYRFEEPVQEFHGILTMYEAYAANKGNVIFKIETEHGQVYASPRIRNFQGKDAYVRFKPTTKLILITDQNGSADEDWSVWLRPEVR